MQMKAPFAARPCYLSICTVLAGTIFTSCNPLSTMTLLALRFALFSAAGPEVALCAAKNSSRQCQKAFSPKNLSLDQGSAGLKQLRSWKT